MPTSSCILLLHTILTLGSSQVVVPAWLACVSEPVSLHCHTADANAMMAAAAQVVFWSGL